MHFLLLVGIGNLMLYLNIGKAKDPGLRRTILCSECSEIAQAAALDASLARATELRTAP